MYELCVRALWSPPGVYWSKTNHFQSTFMGVLVLAALFGDDLRVGGARCDDPARDLHLDPPSALNPAGNLGYFLAREARADDTNVE